MPNCQPISRTQADTGPLDLYRRKELAIHPLEQSLSDVLYRERMSRCDAVRPERRLLALAGCCSTFEVRWS
jgi:hypothetical protein